MKLADLIKLGAIALFNIVTLSISAENIQILSSQECTLIQVYVE